MQSCFLQAGGLGLMSTLGTRWQALKTAAYILRPQFQRFFWEVSVKVLALWLAKVDLGT